MLLRERNTTLEEFLRDRQSRGLGYEAIARDIHIATDQEISVSYQTIKRWLAELEITEEVTP